MKEGNEAIEKKINKSNMVLFQQKLAPRKLL